MMHLQLSRGSYAAAHACNLSFKEVQLYGERPEVFVSDSTSTSSSTSSSTVGDDSERQVRPHKSKLLL